MKLKAQLAETIGDGADGMQTDDRDSDAVGRYYKEIKSGRVVGWLFKCWTRGIRLACRAPEVERFVKRQILVRE